MPGNDGPKQRRANRIKERLALKFPQVKNSRAALVLAAAAHLLAWIAFLWIALYPHAYQGVSATPVNVQDQGAMEVEVVRTSASFVEVNGYRPLILLFIPVLVTGLALMSLLAWQVRRAGNTLILWVLAAILLVFCGLGYLSFGVLYAPSALALIVSAAVFSFRRRLPTRSDG